MGGLRVTSERERYYGGYQSERPKRQFSGRWWSAALHQAVWTSQYSWRDPVSDPVLCANGHNAIDGAVRPNTACCHFTQECSEPAIASAMGLPKWKGIDVYTNGPSSDSGNRLPARRAAGAVFISMQKKKWCYCNGSRSGEVEAKYTKKESNLG